MDTPSISGTGESSIPRPGTQSPESNTQDLDIAMNKTFDYPTILSTSQLRILEILPKEPTGKIEGRYHIINLEDLNNTNYTALSYTWDKVNTVEDLREIQINDQPFFVRINLHNFLERASRSMAGRFIYIDAVCVDQSDPAEKGHQVQMMTAIYSQASEVMVWLGLADPDPEISAGLASLSSNTSWASSDLNPNRDEEKALNFIYSRPYWERVWIIQEILLAADLVLLCGDYSYPWSRVLDLQPKTSKTGHIQVDRFGKVSFDKVILSGRGTTIAHVPFFRILEYKTKWAYRSGVASNSMDSSDRHAPRSGNRQFTKIPLHIALSSFWKHECTDPRDKLYGILGLIEDDIRADIQPDYTLSVNQVYRIALEHGFRSIDARFSDMLAQPLAFDILPEAASNQIKLVEPMPRIPGSSGLIDRYVFSRTVKNTLSSSYGLGPSELPRLSGIAGMYIMCNLVIAYERLARSLHKTFRLSVAEVQETRAQAISHLLSKKSSQPFRMNISEARPDLTIEFNWMAYQTGLVRLMEYDKPHKESERPLLTAEQFAPHVVGTDTRFAYHFLAVEHRSSNALDYLRASQLVICLEITKLTLATDGFSQNSPLVCYTSRENDRSTRTVQHFM
ncbi:heterokaryon incompatibility protein-domain-containing protein [Xylariaceae sp. FL0662B]|nr:heterokaryon incompatibility protein-domain-containing protein [Xylariaceae sp. FL0662B]